MPGPYTGTPKALQYFGSILGAAFERASTADIWEGIQSLAGSLGQDTSGITIFDVNQMRGIAGQMISSQQALLGANPTDAIDSSMIGIPPNTVTGSGTGLPESYLIRVEYTSICEDGSLTQDWTSIYLDSDPNTMTGGDLYDYLSTETQAAAEAYNTAGVPCSFLAIDSYNLTQV